MSRISPHAQIRQGLAQIAQGRRLIAAGEKAVRAGTKALQAAPKAETAVRAMPSMGVVFDVRERQYDEISAHEADERG